MAKPIELKVHLAKDEDSGRWYIAESDIPGLRVEADTPDALIRIVEDVAPDLIELNIDEVMKNVVDRARRKSPQTKPSVLIRPVFDSPLAVAC